MCTREMFTCKIYGLMLCLYTKRQDILLETILCTNVWLLEYLKDWEIVVGAQVNWLEAELETCNHWIALIVLRVHYNCYGR